MVMSATLDVAALKGVLGSDTPVIESSGREFSVETRYCPVEGDLNGDAVGDALRPQHIEGRE